MNRKIFSIVIVCYCMVASAAGQHPVKPGPAPVVSNKPQLTKQQLQLFQKAEDSLLLLAKIMMWDTGDLVNRKAACYRFIPKFMHTLKNDNSFYYGFDSLFNVSRLYPPDSSFRLFTWQLHYPKGRFRYYGVLQMKGKKARLFPLKDLRDTLPFHTQQTLTNENWYGQIYYRILENTVKKKTYYTLFGFEAADFISKRKILDVMTFDSLGRPRFGAPVFNFSYSDTTRLKMKDTLSRFFIEYKWSASPTLNYDDNLNLIVVDHLAPPNPRAKGAYFTYVQDGTYEGFKWVTDHWEWIEKVFTFSIDEDDNPPIPVPLFGEPKRQPVLPK
ncbi:MAG: hypothetical protein U0T84_01035 [Chitinophagales bacterium]